MNITFQNIANKRTENEAIKGSMEAAGRMSVGSQKTEKSAAQAIAVDLDASLFSNDAYSSNSRDFDDISNMAQNTDVLNRHNYMALLSNTMSEEDYAKALDDGFDIKNLSSAETVTIVDKIKSVLLQSGVEITGYNDDLSLDKLTRITGSRAFASELKKSFSENDIPITEENIREAKAAYDELSQINGLDDSAVKYMVLNNKKATIENLYMAQHSTNGQNALGRGFYAQETGGYYAQKADDYNWEQLRPQMEKVMSDAGFDMTDEKALEGAKWTVMQGIPLTADNLEVVMDLRSIEFPVSDNQSARAIAAAIADGQKGVGGNISDPVSNLNKAAEIADKVQKISDDAPQRVISSGQELNLKNLIKAADDSYAISAADTEVDSSKVVSARLQLEEVRLKMTVEANKQLLDSGFSIDTAPMEQLIERLKNLLGQQGDEEAGEIVDEHTKVTGANADAVFRLTVSRVDIIKRGPVDISGAMADELETATLGKISETSAKLTMKFKAASEGYEELMTSPRTDLGDSIKKAFRNVDDILEDMGQEITDENRRAVRILGYNSMKIDEGNFEKVRAWDQKLRVTIDRLKPGAVLDLIREGRNPLGMTIEELGQSLDASLTGEDKGDSSYNRKGDEKYAKFLYKLEHKGEISKEEKASFIGIYRLFHTLKATDYQAIGSLLKTGQDMTIGNLLAASRTQITAKRGMDYTVDDAFGGVSLKEKNSEIKIDEQINSAFRFYTSQADIVYENLEPEKLLIASPDQGTPLQELAQELEKAEIDRQLERQYSDEQLRQIRETASSRAAEGAIYEMDEAELELTYNNLEAVISNRRDRRSGGIWERTAELGSEIGSAQEKMVSLLDESDYENSYLKQLNAISDRLSDELMNADDTYIDVRAISLMQRQLSVMAVSSEKGSFEIPVDIDGNKVSMHVTLKSDDSNITRMDASIQTYEFGTVSASLYEKDGVISGMLTTTDSENSESAEYLEGVKQKLCERLASRIKDIGVDQSRISILYHTQSRPAGVGTVNAKATEGEQKKITDTGTLLKMAKAFIEAL